MVNGKSDLLNEAQDALNKMLEESENPNRLPGVPEAGRYTPESEESYDREYDPTPLGDKDVASLLVPEMENSIS